MAATATLKMMLLGEDKGAAKTLKTAGKEAEVAGHKFHGMGELVRHGLEAFAVVEGIKMAGEFLVDSAKAAVKDQQANAILAKQLHNTAGATEEQSRATEEWLVKQSEATGIARDQLTPALTRLVTATHDVGKAQNLMSLALNVSAGTGKSMTAVSMALAKAQNGSVGGLAKLGVATKDAAGKTLSFHAIQKKLAETFRGDAAAAADTAGGKMKRLGVIWEETKVTVGEHLLPVLTTVAGFLLSNVVPAIGKVGQFIGQYLIPPIRLVSEWIGQHILPLFHQFGSDGPSMLSRVQAGIHPLVAAFQGFVAAVIPIVKQVVTFIRANWGPITAWARQTFGQLRQIVGLAFQLIVQYIRDATAVIKFIWSHWGNDILAVAKRIWQAIGGVITGALKIIGGILKVALSLLKGDWSGAWDGIKQILSGAWKVMTSVISLAWDGIKKAVSLGIKASIAVLKGLPGLILKAVVGFDKLLWSAGVAIIQGLINGIGSMAGTVEDKIGSIASGAVNKVKGILGIHSPSRVFTEIGRNIMEGLGIGLDKGKVQVSKALDALTGYIQAKGSQISDLLSKRGNIVSSLQGFTSSVFGQDLSNPTTGAAPSAGSLLAYQQLQRNRAVRLRGDVGKLVKMGLSRDLIQQLASSGESGIAQIHALAQGSASQVRQLNALNAQTQTALTGAGMSAGNALYGDAIAAAQKDKATALEIRNQLEQWRREQDKNTVVAIHLEGRTLQMSLLQLKRANGGKALGLT